jgi:outer membrane protein
MTPRNFVVFSVVAGLAAACVAIPATAQAQTDAQSFAGTFMVRVRAIGIIPENLSSSITAIGGNVAVTKTPAPEVDLSYYLTDHLAVEVIAASTRHEASAQNSVLGHVDVGSVYVLPPTLTLQYHPFPHSRFSPYVGGGLTAAFFYDSHPALPTVTSVGFSNGVGGAIQAGVDYHVGGSWYLNADVKQIFLNTTARLNGGAIVAKTALDPTVVGAGVGYRF